MTIELTATGVDVATSDGQPAALVSLGCSSLFGRADVGMVEIFTADAQRARSSQAYVRSAIGDRLRITHTTGEGAGDARVVVQRDSVSGVQTRTELLPSSSGATVRVLTRVTNTSNQPVTLTAVSSVNFGVGFDEHLDGLVAWFADSTWLSENRWRAQPLKTLVPVLDLALHEQDGRGRFGLTSHGAWSTGEHLPVGMIIDESSGEAIAWQIESGTGWQVDIAQTRTGIVLSLLGPTDLEGHFAHTLAPGETFSAVPVAIATSHEGREGVVAELTAYRRELRGPGATLEGLPVIYNDFMNTLMGQPSTEALLPLIEEAGHAGVEIFCIDAGWFADPAIGDWWATVGEWIEAPSRFSHGLRAVLDEVHARGMRSGIWLEPEVVGVHSPIAHTLPDGAFFHRFGQRVVEADRYHLDFRHPAVIRHMDEVVDRLVNDYGVTFFKLDYNINPGAGTDEDATAPGAGLLGHSRAFRDWLVAIQNRHPQILIENCSSGAMRADYHLLEVTHLQSTSDQQDALLYPPIAASAPASIAPEQCGNWAYPSAAMDDEETVFTLVTGLSGRLYLSGFLDRLRQEQRDLVHEAIATHKELRDVLHSTVPFWPLGLPGWNDDVICLGLRGDEEDLLFVWDRRPQSSEVVLPGVRGVSRQVFPHASAQWDLAPTTEGLLIRTVTGPTARVLGISRTGR